MLYKICLRKTYLTFFQNNENRQFCINHSMVNGNHQLIPGSGVNLDYHTQKEYPSESDPISFVYCSRIRKEKGIEEFISAAESIHIKYPHIEFHVLGPCEENYEQRLMELTDCGILVYHGKQSDVRPYYKKCHCIVHPTCYPEGMSNVLLEGCAAGRPVITTDRAGCREIVDEGLNGFFVKQHDSNDLVAKLEKFINLPYEKKKQMGIYSRNKVEREFNRQIVIKAYLDVVNKIRLKQ